MSLRRLDPKMIVNLHDVVEKRLSNIFAQLEASLADQVKEGMVEFCRCLWSWSLPI